MRPHGVANRLEYEMSGLNIEIPADLSEVLRIPRDEQELRLRRELAVRLYQKGLLPFGKARELAQMTKWGFHFLLGEEGIVRNYDLEELQEDLETLEALD
jgi:predicted HTH domain antitoxin